MAGSAQHGPLQRQCACGQHTVGGGECEECSKKKSVRRELGGSVLPHRAADSGTLEAVPPIVYDVLRSPGQPLEAETRAFFEPRFGYDFSSVRVHTDPGAAESARAINGYAYTNGHHVVFGEGRYTPSSGAGKRLLAHELAHVVQQSGATAGPSEPLVLSDPGQDSEMNAEEAAEKLSKDRQVVAPRLQSARTLARKSLEPTGASYEPSRISEAYWKLPKTERAKVNEEVDKLFKEQTGVSRQLAWNEPKDRPLARRWLRIRDAVMEKRGVPAQALPQPAEAKAEIVPPPTAAPIPAPHPATTQGISFELAEAAKLPDIPTKLRDLSPAESHVLAWLRVHKDEVANTERERKIDRRAISGAIAWEALVNVRSGSMRAVGPGKVHVVENPVLGGEETVAQQVEERGYAEKQTFGSRLKLLATPSGSIYYIGAIMAAIADLAERYSYPIRCNAPILTMVYQAWDLKQWEAKLSAKKGREPLQLGSGMGTWVADHLEYLEEAVGKPEGLRYCGMDLVLPEEFRKLQHDVLPLK